MRKSTIEEDKKMSISFNSDPSVSYTKSAFKRFSSPAKGLFEQSIFLLLNSRFLCNCAYTFSSFPRR